MKHLFLLAVFAVLMISCQKEFNNQSYKSDYLKNVKKFLNDSLQNKDYANLDFSNAILTKLDSGRGLLRIPFQGIKISKNFVLLQTDYSGVISKGFIIKMNKSEPEKGKEYEFNGFIKLSSFNRKSERTLHIMNGHINNNHPSGTASRSLVVPVPQDTIMIVATTDGGGPYSDWISISGIFGNYGKYGGYVSLGEGGHSSSGLGYSPSGIGEGQQTVWTKPEFKEIRVIEPLFLNVEIVEDLSPIDITQYLKCFSNIPDEGSTCSIEILSDIPVDDQPNILLNWQTGSPGHTFLQIRKSNGNQSVMQNIGFYPLQGWKTMLTPAPITGKFVDNSQHEFNAGLKMNLTPEQLKNVIIEISYLARFVKYDIDDYNCTDFALEVFNSARISNPIEIPKYNLPGGMAPNGSSTPQGLFNKLKSMQQAGIESGNITIPGVKGWVGQSDGPCN
jgi:hypothetical protein